MRVCSWFVWVVVVVCCCVLVLCRVEAQLHAAYERAAAHHTHHADLACCVCRCRVLGVGRLVCSIFSGSPGAPHVYALLLLAAPTCRGWYYHKEYKAWLTRAPNTEPVQKTDRWVVAVVVVVADSLGVLAGSLGWLGWAGLALRTTRLLSYLAPPPRAAPPPTHSQTAGLSAAPSSCLTPTAGRWCARTASWCVRVQRRVQDGSNSSSSCCRSSQAG